MEATDESQVGTHEMVLAVFLRDYPPMLDIPFVIEIQGCSITQLSIDDPDSDTYAYSIESPANILELPIPAFSVTPPTCSGGDFNGLNFEITQSRPNPQISKDLPSVLRLETDDPFDYGPLQVTLTLSPAHPSNV